MVRVNSQLEQMIKYTMKNIYDRLIEIHEYVMIKHMLIDLLSGIL